MPRAHVHVYKYLLLWPPVPVAADTGEHGQVTACRGSDLNTEHMDTRGP